MFLRSLSFAGFRNLADDTVAFGPGVNLILGDNGQGKSNLLEAVAVLGTLRSFRTPNLRRCIRHDGAAAVLSGEVVARDRSRRLALELRSGRALERRQFVDGEPAPVDRYLEIFPVEVLTGRREDLVSGEPQVRRSFLDRLAFQLRPTALPVLRRYRKLLAQRNAWLRQGGRGAEGMVWETQLAASAAQVVALRRWVVELLVPVVAEVFSDVAACRVSELSLGYQAESWLPPGLPPDELAEIYEKRYASARERDGRLGFTGAGPHRHDLNLLVKGRSAAEQLSSGQAKLVAATLRLAARELVERDGEAPEVAPIVMDDADAELDREALGALLRRAGRGRQVILSSPRGQDIRRELRPDTVSWLTDGRILRGVDVEMVYDEPVHG